MRLKSWCIYCKFKTWQVCRPELQGVDGLPWMCERCKRLVERSAHQASMGER